MSDQQLNDLPQEVKELPENAQHIFLAAFNTVKENSGEESALKVAWDSVKEAYTKGNDGKWHRKQDPDQYGTSSAVQSANN